MLLEVVIILLPVSYSSTKLAVAAWLYLRGKSDSLGRRCSCQSGLRGWLLPSLPCPVCRACQSPMLPSLSALLSFLLRPSRLYIFSLPLLSPRGCFFPPRPVLVWLPIVPSHTSNFSLLSVALYPSASSLRFCLPSVTRQHRKAHAHQASSLLLRRAHTRTYARTRTHSHFQATLQHSKRPPAHTVIPSQDSGRQDCYSQTSPLTALPPHTNPVHPPRSLHCTSPAADNIGPGPPRWLGLSYASDRPRPGCTQYMISVPPLAPRIIRSDEPLPQ